MVTGGALGDEVADLVQGPVDADDFHDVGIFPGNLQAASECGGEGGAAHGGDAGDLFSREHRHDAGNDGNRDPGGPTAIDEAEVNFVVEEELRSDEIRAGVDLSL